MSKNKYFDYANDKPVDSETDGCVWADWNRLHKSFAFSGHPEGFRVFLPPDTLATCNEYAKKDPYTVEKDKSSAFHKRRTEITVQLLRQAIKQQTHSARVLDLGCGQGHITEELRQALENAEITGLDYSLSAIEYAHKHFPGIDFAVGDAYSNPYARGYFDVVVCNNLWEHVPDPLMLLRGIRRALKPNGHLIVSTPSRYRLANLVRVLQGKPVSFMSPRHVTEYTVGQVKEQLAYGGFEVRSVLSRTMPGKSLKASVAKCMLSKWIAAVGSHHQLEATVFYLSQEAACSTDSDAAREEGRGASPSG